jgi:hypothetical protein
LRIFALDFDAIFYIPILFFARNILARLPADHSGFPPSISAPYCPFLGRCADIGYAAYSRQ